MGCATYRSRLKTEHDLLIGTGFRGILLRSRCQPRGRDGSLSHSPVWVCVSCASSCCRHALAVRAYGALGRRPAPSCRARLQRTIAERFLRSVGRIHASRQGREAVGGANSLRLADAAPYTRAIRTYSSTGGVQRAERDGADGASLVPAVANEFGLKVTLGVWIDKDAKRNEREIRAGIELARRHSNVDAIVVGNETLYRDETIFIGDKDGYTPEERAKLDEAAAEAKRKNDKKIYEEVLQEINVERLVKVIQRVKRETPVPVTTGEIWHAWRHPRARFGGRFHRRPHPCVLGRLPERPRSTRPSGSTISCARIIPASAS